MEQNVGIGIKYSVYTGVPSKLKYRRTFWGHLVHFDFRQPCSSYMAGHRAKWYASWTSGVFSIYRPLWQLRVQAILTSFSAFSIFHFWPCSVQGHFGIVQCTVSKNVLDTDSKMGQKERNLTAGTLVQNILAPCSWIYRGHLLHSWSNQGHFGLHMSKLGLFISATQPVRTWKKEISVTWSYLASDQA